MNINTILGIIKRTPFYPHWLETKNREKGDKKVYEYLFGKVIETGAASLGYKKKILRTNQKVKWYISTDYSSWDEYRSSYKMLKQSFFGKMMHSLMEIHGTKNPEMICSANDLPLQGSSFDSYCSFEVLEHVRNPRLMLLEANRVLKKKGICVLTVPFLYREHPLEHLDFQRFTRNGIRNIAESCGFRLITNTTYSFIGTTVASQFNQFIIRVIIESKFPIKIIILVMSPIIFFVFNIIGYFLDYIQSDMRFATRYHIVLEKHESETK